VSKEQESMLVGKPDRPEHTCELREIVELLVRHYGLHEGIWGPWIEFGIGGANIINATDNKAAPAAIVPIVRFGIQKFATPSSMTVDAAQINPLKSRVRKRAARTKRGR
jgi:hypothetical protein